jgi:hypothetical protein
MAVVRIYDVCVTSALLAVRWAECGLRVFEKRVTRIFGRMRNEMGGSWRILHSERLYNLQGKSKAVPVLK